jgi:hypothetical protein
MTTLWSLEVLRMHLYLSLSCPRLRSDEYETIYGTPGSQVGTSRHYMERGPINHDAFLDTGPGHTMNVCV